MPRCPKPFCPALCRDSSVAVALGRSWERLIESGGMTIQLPNPSNGERPTGMGAFAGDALDNGNGPSLDGEGGGEQAKGLSTPTCRKLENC